MKTLPNVALSIRQPWCQAIVHGAKRIENRTGWRNSHFRGPFLVHAARGMTEKEYWEARRFCEERHVSLGDKKRDHRQLERGGIVGVATVVGVVLPSQLPMFDKKKESWRVYTGDTRKLRSCSVRPMSTTEYAWWAGGFALVLDDVKPLPFTACTGALGFFKVGSDVLRKLEAGRHVSTDTRSGVTE